MTATRSMSPIKADLCLFLVAAIWGTGFVAQRLGMDHVSPMLFTAARFGLGALTLVAFAAFLRAFKKTDSTSLNEPSHGMTLLGGGLAGLTLFCAAGFQQSGIAGTTAGSAGFITGLYVVFVPALGLMIGRIPDRAAMCGALIALTGLYFLSMKLGFSMSWGDGLVLISAFFWALHVLIIGWLAPRIPAIRLNVVQFTVAAALAFIVVLTLEEVDLDGVEKALPAILYSGILAVAVAFGLQTVAQKVASPTRTAVLLSTESLFAAIAGFLLLGELFTIRQSFGAVLMLSGVLVTILLSGRRKKMTDGRAHSGT